MCFDLINPHSSQIHAPNFLPSFFFLITHIHSQFGGHLLTILLKIVSLPYKPSAVNSSSAQGAWLEC